ncbi:bis(5'-nucleosyl)-tetraphosphatase [Patescibacteria group bacterium]
MITYDKSAGAVIYREENGENLYLLLRYRNYHWDFVKGHTEKGETLAETMIRETEEETGITDLRMEKKFKKNIYYYYRAKGNERKERLESGRKINIIKKVIYFLAETSASDVKLSHEHIDFVWLNYEKAVQKVTFDNARNVLAAADKYLKKNSR